MRRFVLTWPAVLSIGLSVLLAAACANDGSRCTALPGGSRYCLQTTASVVPFDVQQKVDVVFDGRMDTIIAQVETDALGMRFVGTTPFGQKLVQLSFDNERVTLEASQMKGLDPILLLALVQIASWPAASVRAGLGDSALVVDAEGQRRLVKDDSDLVVIKYTRGRPPLGDVSIQLPKAGVEFTIINLDVADNP